MKYEVHNLLKELGIEEKSPVLITGTLSYHASNLEYVPIRAAADGQVLGHVQMADKSMYEQAIETSRQAFDIWRDIPAPQRGEIIRQIADAIRGKKEALGKLIAWEMGKIVQEGMGEVQEVIDICDFAVGLSRQLYGLTMQSERKHHRMFEQWHPLGVVGIISAFNFPIAVWAWNAMIAAVCGNTTIWKPSEKTPLTAIAAMKTIQQVLRENDVPEGVFTVLVGDRETGQRMADDTRIPLISATGSTRMGKAVAESVAKRLGKSILELGGNNAVIITKHANLQLAIPAIIFGSVGTCGQRCTTTRRVIIDEDIYEEFKSKMISAYHSLESRIGHPLDEETLIGPLIDQEAAHNMEVALENVQREGGKLLFGGGKIEREDLGTGTYVIPAIVEAHNDFETVQSETFAPIVYLIPYQSLEEAVAINNGVPQGLSSAIFTENMKESERFLSLLGSDCGIANVNIGTSGAEIGGAFGGEKETGGGRESGSDAWKAYMRRQTNTVNWSDELPLAQGIKFDI